MIHPRLHTHGTEPGPAARRRRESVTTNSATARALRGEPTAATAALAVQGLSKTFPGTRALMDAAIEIRPGEVHARVGQNGPGRTTLIKTLAGYHTPDARATAEREGGQVEPGNHD